MTQKLLTIITLVGKVERLEMETLVDYESFIFHRAAGTSFVLIKSVIFNSSTSVRSRNKENKHKIQDQKLRNLLSRENIGGGESRSSTGGALDLLVFIGVSLGVLGGCTAQWSVFQVAGAQERLALHVAEVLDHCSRARI